MFYMCLILLSRPIIQETARVHLSIVRVIVKIRWDLRGRPPRAVFRPNIQKQSLKSSSDGTGVRLTTTRIDSRFPPNGLCDDDKLDETLVSFR
jgi:hypothetical protein